MSDKKPELLFFYGPTASGKSSVIWTLLEGKAEGTQLGDGKTQSPTGPYTRPIRGII
jgi:AAA+ ATPase superfamily predicted ATPase